MCPRAETLRAAIFRDFVVISADHHDLDVVLQPGEWFGGHSFVEWREVAAGAGVVCAEWLDV
jgi:hypothetical protein